MDMLELDVREQMGGDEFDLYDEELEDGVEADTTVVNKRDIGVLGPNDEYIGRGTHWGNPWSHKPSKYHVEHVATAEEAVRRYEPYIRQRLNESADLRRMLWALKGHRLVCYCKPGPCHGDVLVKLINEYAAWRASHPGRE